MASLELRGGRYRVVFRFGGRKFQHPLRAASEAEASSCLARLEENLRLLERGRLTLPIGADLPTFLLSDGKLAEKPAAPELFAFQSLHDRYLETHGNGAMERNLLDTAAMHLRHFRESFGAEFLLQTLTLNDLQRHVDRRSRKKGVRGRPLSPVTLRKEMASFRAAWNWAVQAGFVVGSFPNRGVRYPKAGEKPPFQTWAEIERQLARGGLSLAEVRDHWDCLFLTLPEISALLGYFEANAGHDWIYPMVGVAAHTGARRSELLRAKLQDLDLEGETIQLHERKRARDRRTSRRVPLSPLLVGNLKDWLARHPGGTHLFCQRADIFQSKTKRIGPTSITRNEAHDHFHRTVAGSRWQVLRGWHVLRHSFASNLAAKGVDQRLIDEWMGHQTEEMRKRYRHLFPSQSRQVLCSVFEASV